jgi:hypothetical protein
MGTNIKMGKFLETNILDTISRKYKYDPTRSLPYLDEITEQLKQVQVLVNETKDYMNTVVKIKEEDENKEFLNTQKDVL